LPRQVQGVSTGPGFVEVIHTPDETAFFVAPGAKILDLHVENFGTWRDEEGRLIWGVNDLDEAWPCAYTLDLARLTTSAYLAISEEHLSLTRREAAEAVEEGYRDALAAGGKAFVLAE